MEIAYPNDVFSGSVLEAVLSLSTRFDVFTILNSNESADGYQLIAAFGLKELISDYSTIALADHCWKFGYISYDVKNRIEKLYSANSDRIQAPDTFMYVPQIVILCRQGKLSILADSPEEEELVYKQLQECRYESKKIKHSLQLKGKYSRATYLERINQVKEHIRRGDIYEMNFCMEFFAENAQIEPVQVYTDLNAISHAPFSFCSRFNDVWAIGSSPERFLKKKGNILTTQPIKGTAARSENKEEDERLKQELRLNEKERNENVMIVDVARNDLSRLATKGSVKVDELFEVYSFKQVHQLISKVSCELLEEKIFKDIIDATFPPASMTGAPKIRAMQIIEETEDFKRGIYSGILGYIDPSGDFDFNVVIRTILYNQKEQQVSYAVGSAITDKCNAEEEYEECLLKAIAMKRVLEKVGEQ